jgi:hypothetical protein
MQERVESHENGRAISHPSAVVRQFYAYAQAREIEQLLALVDEYFASDVVLHEPESLPYGGAYEGRDRVKQVFRGLGSPRSPIEVSELRVDELMAAPSDDDGRIDVFVALSFPWVGLDETRHVRALEWWTFRDLIVERISVYLWDTAAAIAALRRDS